VLCELDAIERQRLERVGIPALDGVKHSPTQALDRFVRVRKWSVASDTQYGKDGDEEPHDSRRSTDRAEGSEIRHPGLPSVLAST
jgi:hypothetical protein